MSWADVSEEQCLIKIYDNVTSQDLDQDEVMKARVNQIEGLKETQAWEVVPHTQCFERTGKNPTRVGWVDVDKGTTRTRCTGPGTWPWR